MVRLTNRERFLQQIANLLRWKPSPQSINQGRREGGGYPGLLPRGPGQKGARTQTVTNLQVLQDMK